MFRTLSIRASCLLLLVPSILFGPLPLNADDLKTTDVAGHRILKLYNEKNNAISLPNSLAIFEDRSGRYWVGTYGGLVLYDEKQDRWLTFATKADGSSFGQIEAISQSTDNRLWVITGSSAVEGKPNVSYFDGKLWQDPALSPDSYTIKQPISAMFSGRDGRIWVASKDELITNSGQHWNPVIRLSELIGDDYSVRVKAGLQGSDGCVWLATSEGIIRSDERGRNWKIIDPIPQKNDAGDEAEPSGYVRMAVSDGVYRIYEDRKGRIWFASITGPLSYHLVYDKKKYSWRYYQLAKHLPQGSGTDNDLGLTVIYHDKAGKLMFGTKIGLITFDEALNKWELFTPENSGLPGPSITAIFEDRSNRIWIGTNKGIVVLQQ